MEHSIGPAKLTGKKAWGARVATLRLCPGRQCLRPSWLWRDGGGEAWTIAKLGSLPSGNQTWQVEMEIFMEKTSINGRFSIAMCGGFHEMDGYQ